MQISFEVTVKCVHRCITDPHIAEHNKDIKCKTCLMGTFITALASQTRQDLGNFQIILDPQHMIRGQGLKEIRIVLKVSALALTSHPPMRCPKLPHTCQRLPHSSGKPLCNNQQWKEFVNTLHVLFFVGLETKHSFFN